MGKSISLATKCVLLIGAAVVVLIASAQLVPWFRQAVLVDRSQIGAARDIARLWSENPLLDPQTRWALGLGRDEIGTEQPGLSIQYWPVESWRDAEFQIAFLDRARARLFPDAPSGERPPEEHWEAVWDGSDRVYRLVHVMREEGRGTPVGIVYVERRSASAAGLLLVERVFLIVAGLVATAISVLVYYFVTKRLFLQPVRALRATAERVREGNLSIRSDIQTGDEFEELAGAFNTMLTTLQEQQQQLRGINASLDLKLTELAEKNYALFEAAKLKGEFLASVSHELRTPLNSIIGFAEILEDIAEREADAPEIDERARTQLIKRKRYIENIVRSGRALLEMINELLTMAKLEAGTIEIDVQPMNVGETCEGLVALIRPLADKKEIRLELQLDSAEGPGFNDASRYVSDPRRAALPVVETDQQKLQQIVFNFLSNAVKFTPERGTVVMRAEREHADGGRACVRVSVIDSGPGIAPSEHARVFERFTQVDGTHTKLHQGTGLGLAIAREFADLLGATIELVSDVGKGAAFSVVVPVRHERSGEPSKPLAFTSRLGASITR
ncbi:MAG: ATP-binding protein [Planctomycetota bacterium]